MRREDLRNLSLYINKYMTFRRRMIEFINTAA